MHATEYLSVGTLPSSEHQKVDPNSRLGTVMEGSITALHPEANYSSENLACLCPQSLAAWPR